MFDTTIFTPWVLFTDLGIIFGLLLIGKFIRVKVKIIQKLFIPPSLIAGILGLVFGPNGLDWLPLSTNTAIYPAILIAVVFGALPLASPKFTVKEVAKRVGPMWGYAQLGMLMQWAIMGLFGILVLKMIWPNLNSAFGVMLPTGFYGGHGTAAAIGSAFEGLGWDEATSLGMTTATIGVIVAIVGGLFFVKNAARHKQTSYISDFDNLPNELRSGLLPKDKRESSGEITTSPISIDSFTFHLALVIIAAFGGYLISKGVKMWYPKLELPVFSCAFIVGLIMKKIFDKVKVSEYIDPKTTNTISSCSTDLLVAFGVASIKLGVVVKYAVPLIVLLVVGIVVVYYIVFFFGKHLHRKDWFEKSIFAWGWWTGSMAMGIALLRIVDPKMQSKAMDDYALAYLPCAPVEILLITFVPILFMNGMGLWLMLGCLVLSFLIIFLARKIGWWIPKAEVKARDNHEQI
ncbi:MAG: sodium/glutamate symporter [Bacteroidales bacterium]|nr:sodium/glutamate symporter [Bacteroidales bacterium]MDD4669477.1 sodium/glutamate symporter [Bacteroidales bacterium]